MTTKPDGSPETPNWRFMMEFDELLKKHAWQISKHLEQGDFCGCPGCTVEVMAGSTVSVLAGWLACIEGEYRVEWFIDKYTEGAAAAIQNLRDAVTEVEAETSRGETLQ